jgi:glycosyltransferase 2 family protein
LGSLMMKTRKLIVPLGIMISGFLMFVLYRERLEESYQRLSGVSFDFLAAGVGALFCSYIVRSIRWGMIVQFIFPKSRKRTAARNYFLGNALNNVLPFRAGDLYRLADYTGQKPTAFSSVSISLGLEKLLDVVGLLAIFSLAISFSSGISLSDIPDLIQRLVGVLLAAMLVATIFMIIFFRQILSDRLMMRLPLFVQENLKACSKFLTDIGKPSEIILLISLSVGAWSLEVITYVFLTLSFGITLTLSQCVVLCVVATFSTLIPSAPGYFGTYHFVVTSVLVALGFLKGDALSLALFTHGVLWLSVICFGLIGFVFFREPKVRDDN